MPSITRSALVMFSAQQMYELVNDVDSYPQFLPGCVASRIVSESDTSITAALEVAKVGIRKTFTTRNELKPHRHISMELVDGPFKSLSGGWSFTPLDVDACKVELKLHFEFTSRLVEMAFGGVFKELANAMVHSFSERAREVYGRESYSG
ncbi:ribosome-associated toxin RatA of RatAB toxin-antitoxin module [Oceanisphaera litoralis]|uniref:SRPBCC family protein n=1 Tax=Oceanisphaera litoralis TaxID=225144 RepID=UPI00195DA0CC|nr:SRPBCC family protein [Oceanisphaera litoralis]MBM7454380.1 ribosome-associated toxin RatA of RatAB toxin-antitoxin module [Oceanisphaera litoralis]